MKPRDFTEGHGRHCLSLVGSELRIKPAHYRNPAVLPARTRRNIAVCAAVGLTWWSEHPESGALWAADFEGGFHELLVSEKYKTVRHMCGSWNGTYRHSRPCTISGPPVGWAMPASSGGALTLLADDGVPATEMVTRPGAVMDEHLGPTGHCSSGRHDKCKYRPGAELDGGIALTGGGRYDCPCACHPVQREKVRQMQEKQDQAEAAIKAHGLIPVSDLVAVRMIERDPACIAGLHIDYLRGALGHTEYDDRITTELERRLEAAS